ncbi:MAG: GIY-YIG nuclease family protein [Pseudomonadota bacterium]
MARFDVIAAYIMANRKNGAIYTGSTSDLQARAEQHKLGSGSGFTAKYGCARLAWYEQFEEMALATHRERRIKTWSRGWKVELIESVNPHWDDLSSTW